MIKDWFIGDPPGLALFISRLSNKRVTNNSSCVNQQIFLFVISEAVIIFQNFFLFYVSFHADLSYTFSAIILLSHIIIIIFITAKNENECLFFISYWTGALLTRFYTILCMVGPLIVRIFQPIFLIISIFVPSYLFLPSIPFLPDSFSLFDGLLLPLSVVYVMVISLIYIIAYFIKYFRLRNHTLPKLG